MQSTPLAELAANGTRAAKALPGSTYVRDGQTIFAVTAASLVERTS